MKFSTLIMIFFIFISTTYLYSQDNEVTYFAAGGYAGLAFSNYTMELSDKMKDDGFEIDNGRKTLFQLGGCIDYRISDLIGFEAGLGLGFRGFEAKYKLSW